MNRTHLHKKNVAKTIDIEHIDYMTSVLKYHLFELISWRYFAIVDNYKQGSIQLPILTRLLSFVLVTIITFSVNVASLDAKIKHLTQRKCLIATATDVRINRENIDKEQNILEMNESYSDTIRFILRRSEIPEPRVAIAFSGGGARGIAQIGIMKSLERAHIRPIGVAGTSIGAILGGLWCAGYTAQELDSIVRNVRWDETFSLVNERIRNDLFIDQKYEQDRSILSLRFNNFSFIVPQSISGGVRFTSLLQKLFWSAPYHSYFSFDELKIPFRAVATDIVNAKPVSLSNGNLITAIRASATLPLRYTPVQIDSMILVDGGLLANIPIFATKEFNPDVVIAVNTTSPLLASSQLDKPWNVADQVVSVMMQQFNARAKDSATFILEPNLGYHENTDFSNLDSLILAGENYGNSTNDTIINYLNHWRDSMLITILEHKIGRKLSDNSTDRIKLRLVSPYSKKLDELLAPRDLTTAKTIRDFFQRFSADEYSISVVQSDTIMSIEIQVVPQRFIRKIVLAEVRDNRYRNTEPLRNQNTSSLKDYLTEKAESDSIRTMIESKMQRSFSGNTISPDVLQHLRDSIEAEYKYLSKAFTDVASISVSPDSTTVNVYLISGRIDAVEITGNESASQLYISRELDIKLNKMIDITELNSAWEQVVNTDVFSDVAMHVQRSKLDSSSLALSVKVKERGTQTLRIGGRLDNERNTQFTADFTQENLMSSGVRLGLRIGGGLRNSVGSITFDVPRILNSYWTAQAQGYWNSRNIYLYNNIDGLPRNQFERLRIGDLLEQRYGIKAQFGRQIRTDGKISADIRYEHQRAFQLGDYVNPREYTPLLALSFNTKFDTEDRADFPTRGRVLTLKAERTVYHKIGFANFTKFEAKGRTSFTFGSHTISPSIHLGVANESLPYPEFFNFGGQDVFMGMREEEERGRQLALGQLDYRVKSPVNILFDTYFSLRYDIGRVWILAESIKFENLRHGVSATVSLDTPLGPARFSVGQSFYFVNEPNTVVVGPLLVYFGIGMRIQ
jgi:NTE family protein